jgi:hypothetical protein
VHEPGLYWLSFVDEQYRLYAPMLYKLWDCFFRGDFEKYGKTVFTEHYAEVRALTQEHRLLEFDVKRDGWESLCTFLDVPQPTTPFPNGNDTNDFKVSCVRRNMTKAYRLAMKSGLVVGLMASIMFYGYEPFVRWRWTHTREVV